MPKLNVVAMIVLSLAVFAGAAVMAVRSAPAVRIDAPKVDRLIRQLGDTDPDLRRDAERELKHLGRAAEPALKEAARSSDSEIAARARAILGEKPAAPKRAPAEVVSEPAAKAAEVRLTLQLAASPRRPEEPAPYYLRLHNDTRASVAIARQARDGRPDFRAFGVFERIDAEGRLVQIEIGPSDEDAIAEVVLVAPGESIDLHPGAGLLAIGAKGTYRVRYVYDATEGSEYRARVASSHHAAAALRPERYESNSVVVTIPW